MPHHVMNYIESDLPTEFTLPQWRQARAVASPRRRLGLRTWIPARRQPALAA